MHYLEYEKVVTRFKSFEALCMLHGKLLDIAAEFVIRVPSVLSISVCIDKFQCR